MAEQSLPNTDSRQVMAAAIAWEIVAKAYGSTAFYDIKIDERVKVLTNEWLLAYQAIWNETPIGGEET
jgi:hypothetical protein